MDKLRFPSRLLCLALIAGSFAWCFFLQGRLRRVEVEVNRLDLLFYSIAHNTEPRYRGDKNDELSHVHVPVRDFFIIQHF